MKHDTRSRKGARKRMFHEVPVKERRGCERLSKRKRGGDESCVRTSQKEKSSERGAIELEKTGDFLEHTIYKTSWKKVRGPDLKPWQLHEIKNQNLLDKGSKGRRAGPVIGWYSEIRIGQRGSFVLA